MKRLGLATILMVGMLALPSAASACQVDGWTVGEAARRARLIVEAEVDSVLGSAGYRLRVQRPLKGAVGGALRIGQSSPSTSGDCSGRIRLETGDHVLIALADPQTALAVETAVWWVEPNGVIERANLVEGWRRTTLAAVIDALQKALPDTSVAAWQSPSPTVPVPAVFGAAAVLGFLVAWRRLGRTSSHPAA